MRLLLILLAVLLAHPADATLLLSWNHDGGADKFNIERRLQADTAWQALSTVTGAVRTAVDTTPQPNTSYCYRLNAESGAGKSPYSTEACKINPAVSLHVKAGQVVTVSRRATTGSSVIAILVNKDETVKQNSFGDASSVAVNYHTSKSLSISRRATNGSSVIAVLVNKDDVVTVNGQIAP